jgi:hypothetical protein
MHPKSHPPCQPPSIIGRQTIVFFADGQNTSCGFAGMYESKTCVLQHVRRTLRKSRAATIESLGAQLTGKSRRPAVAASATFRHRHRHRHRRTLPAGAGGGGCTAPGLCHLHFPAPTARSGLRPPDGLGKRGVRPISSCRDHSTRVREVES